MLGKDGRLYDPDFDFDGDGKLNTYEYSIMDDIVFGHDDSNSDTEEEVIYEESQKLESVSKTTSYHYACNGSGICNPIFYHNFKSRILLQEYDIETDSGK